MKNAHFLFNRFVGTVMFVVEVEKEVLFLWEL
jgi:hypothetical protein